eukprot:8500753-Ditylum_brightwellii.AAC.1
MDLSIYRGNDSHNFVTTKTHTLLRTGQNIKLAGLPMNTCCHLGVRLLKMEAKGYLGQPKNRAKKLLLSKPAKELQRELSLTTLAVS